MDKAGGEAADLVDNGAGRQAAEEHVLGKVSEALVLEVLHGLAGQEELALKGVALEALVALEEDLLDAGLRNLGEASDDLVVDGDIAPGLHGQALGLGDLLHNLHALLLSLVIVREEEHANTAHTGKTNQYRPSQSHI